MARNQRHPRLETRSARLSLAVRKKPYTGPVLAPGVTLLYRRNKGNGSWIVRVLAGTAYWTDAFAKADDYAEADGETVLTFFQAQERARKLARGDDAEAVSEAAPITVDRALIDYAADLKARNAYPSNARRVRKYLTPGLAAKPVALLAASELKHWRNGLRDTVKAATLNRMCNGLRAALELAARSDKRIRNRDAWEDGLEGLPGARTARNVILDDAEVHAFVGAAYDRDASLGLFLDVLANTGTRPSQAVRLRVEDLIDHPPGRSCWCQNRAKAAAGIAAPG